jgi:hypothetical protein
LLGGMLPVGSPAIRRPSPLAPALAGGVDP